MIGRLVTGLTTHPFDPRAHGGICDVPEVPRYKVVGAVRNRDGNVSGIFRRRAGHRPQMEQLLCEVGRILGRIEKGDRFERGQTGTGNGFIAGAGLGDNKL